MKYPKTRIIACHCYWSNGIWDTWYSSNFHLTCTFVCCRLQQWRMKCVNYYRKLKPIKRQWRTKWNAWLGQWPSYNPIWFKLRLLNKVLNDLTSQLRDSHWQNGEVNTSILIQIELVLNQIVDRTGSSYPHFY